MCGVALISTPQLSETSVVEFFQAANKQWAANGQEGAIRRYTRLHTTKENCQSILLKVNLKLL